MAVQNMKFVIRTFGIALLTLVCWSVVSSAQTPFVAGTWTRVGNAQSVVLPNGKFMLANCCPTDEALLTLSGTTATWTATGTGKADSNDEEGWTLLPNGKVLTVDANNGASPSTSEIYTPSTGAWTAGPSVGVQLEDPSSHELGPAVLRPYGPVFYAGATPNNAIYHSRPQNPDTAPRSGG